MVFAKNIVFLPGFFPQRHKYIHICIQFHVSLYVYEYQKTGTGDKLLKRYFFSFDESYEEYTVLYSVAGPHCFLIFLVLQPPK
jgi:hypothetical protein